MVVIHCKGKSEEHQFLYETTVDIPVSQLVKELVDIHNTRLRIQRLKVRASEHPPRFENDLRHLSNVAPSRPVHHDPDSFFSLSFPHPVRRAGGGR